MPTLGLLSLLPPQGELLGEGVMPQVPSRQPSLHLVVTVDWPAYLLQAWTLHSVPAKTAASHLPGCWPLQAGVEEGPRASPGLWPPVLLLSGRGVMAGLGVKWRVACHCGSYLSARIETLLGDLKI